MVGGSSHYLVLSWVHHLLHPVDCKLDWGVRMSLGTAEKYQRITNYCENITNCEKCILQTKEGAWCETRAMDELPPHLVDEYYNILFPQQVDHPSHYNRDGSMECIDEMIKVFGVEAVKHFCLLNVWKYRYRAADKNGEEDLKKSDWYMKKFGELCMND